MMKYATKNKLKKLSGVALVLMLVVMIGGGMALSYSGLGDPAGSPEVDQTKAPSDEQDGSDWTVGELRDKGLRIIPSGRSDASAVMDPEQFEGEVRQAYWIATQIPEVLNQLYCWCGCENRGVHRSNLGCFEDEMAVTCAVCRGTAKIAYEMVQDGITDAGKIQAKVDAKWGRL